MGKEKNVGLLRRWFAVTNSPRNGRNGFAFSMYGTNRRSADCRWIRKFQTVPAARGPAHTISYVSCLYITDSTNVRGEMAEEEEEVDKGSTHIDSRPGVGIHRREARQERRC